MAHHIRLASKKIARHTKKQGTQFEETQQTSESDMTGMVGLSEWEFEATDEKDKDSSDQVDSHVRTETSVKQRDINPKNKPEMLEETDAVTLMKNAYGLTKKGWTWLRKAAVSQKMR